MKRLAVVAVLLALVTPAARFGPARYSGAAAQDAPPRSPAEGDELSAVRRAFDEAAELERQGRYEDADARHNLEPTRLRLAQTAAPAAPKPGAAKAGGKPAAPPALAKAGKPAAEVRRPAQNKAEPPPLMVGPDGVVYQPVEASDERPR